MKIYVEPLTERHFLLLYEWFNLPHVQEFYSLRPWTYQDIVHKMIPCLKGEKKVWPFIAYIDGNPAAYIQKYKIIDHPWNDMDLSEDIVVKAAGVDFFMGPKELLKKGLGSKIIQQFLEEQIWPFFDYCMVDPDIRNTPSYQFFKKLGFKEYKKIHTKNALHEEVCLMLMITSKASS